MTQELTMKESEPLEADAAAAQLASLARVTGQMDTSLDLALTVDLVADEALNVTNSANSLSHQSPIILLAGRYRQR
jgi:hypothetical protein